MTEAIHTISADPPIVPDRMNGGRPVLEPISTHSWESHVVLNPAAILVDDPKELDRLSRAWDLDAFERARVTDGTCVMMYRAQGELEPDKQLAPSYLGLAVFTPELSLVRRWRQPVLRPDAPFHNLGVEDARCTRVGDRYYLYYTGYSAVDPQGPVEERRIQICLATTSNFLEWDLHGPVAGDLNAVPNKNAALLPVPVHGKWLLLHRPMVGEGAMAIHLAEAGDPSGPWLSRGLLMESYRYREFARSWIGAGGPPVALGDDRFLMIYHQGHFTEEGSREYDLAAALLDFRGPDIVTSRIEPLMRPSGEFEQRGDADLGVDNVLFTCANYSVGDRLIIPYAGADSRIFGAVVSRRGLVKALEG